MEPKPDPIPRYNGALSFWWEALKKSFTRGWLVACAVNSLLSIGLPFASLLDPKAAEHAEFWWIFDKFGLAWITIGAFWVIVLVRAFYAPYVLYDEVATKCTRLQGALDDKTKQRRIRDTMSGFLSELENMKRIYVSAHMQDHSGVDALIQKIVDFLGQELGVSYVEAFLSNTGLEQEFKRDHGHEHIAVLNFLLMRSTRAKELLDKLHGPMPPS